MTPKPIVDEYANEPFQCPKCSKTFVSYKGYFEHFMTVHRARRYMCPVGPKCVEFFARKNYLADHLERQHPEKVKGMSRKEILALALRCKTKRTSKLGCHLKFSGFCSLKFKGNLFLTNRMAFYKLFHLCPRRYYLEFWIPCLRLLCNSR